MAARTRNEIKEASKGEREVAESYAKEVILPGPSGGRNNGADGRLAGKVENSGTRAATAC